jgi:hypothetical protein
MTPDSLFQIASTVVLPGWATLAFAPLARARCVLIARIVAVLLSGLYVSLLVAGLAGEGPPAGASFDTLEGVRLLLSSLWRSRRPCDDATAVIRAVSTGEGIEIDGEPTFGDDDEEEREGEASF